MIVRLLVTMTFVVACSKPSPSSGGGNEGSSKSSEPGTAEPAGKSGGFQPARGADNPDDNDPCSAAKLGLSGAKKLGRKMLRRGCWPKPITAPLLITKQSEFSENVDCGSGGSTDDAHNWSNGMLVVTSHAPSPAGVGLIAYDDGKAITFVSMQRTPCPNDPQPMPGANETHVFIAEPNGQRTFADRACTVQQACP